MTSIGSSSSPRSCHARPVKNSNSTVKKMTRTIRTLDEYSHPKNPSGEIEQALLLIPV